MSIGKIASHFSYCVEDEVQANMRCSLSTASTSLKVPGQWVETLEYVVERVNHRG